MPERIAGPSGVSIAVLMRGMGERETTILEWLHVYGDLTRSDVAQILGHKSPNNCQMYLGNLVAAGLAEKFRDPTNETRTIYRITELGRGGT